MSDAGWYPDPSGRHEYRYWSGLVWTDTVGRNGVQLTDPLDLGEKFASPAAEGDAFANEEEQTSSVVPSAWAPSPDLAEPSIGSVSPDGKTEESAEWSDLPQASAAEHAGWLSQSGADTDPAGATADVQPSGERRALNETSRRGFETPRDQGALDPMDEMLLQAGVHLHDESQYAQQDALVPPEGSTGSAQGSADKKRRAVWKRPRWIMGCLAVAAAIAALSIWGTSERSSASRWRTDDLRWQTQAHTLDSRLSSTTKDLGRAKSQVADLNNQVSSLASEKARVTDEREQLTQILNTVPSVTGGLRQCASSALTLSQDELDYISAFPYGDASTISADVDSMSTICKGATTDADTLDGLVAGITK